MSFSADTKGISPSAKEVLGQLFMNGPTWDGNVASKNGRGELIRAGLAFHENGFASLTPEGLRVAIEWKEFAKPYTEWSRRWLKKANGG